MPARFLIRRRGGLCRAQDDGFAMVTVVAAMFVLTMLATAGLYYVTAQLPISRQTQDAAASVAAAQAGLDDFIQHLNSCDSYWAPSTCPGGRPAYYVTSARPTAAGTGWQIIPGTTSGTAVGPSSFQYSVVQSPDVSAGTLRVRVSGRTNGETRTITADLVKESFLKYIYYTDLETQSPDVYKATHQADWARLSFSGSTYALPAASQAQADGCAIYHYDGRSNVRFDQLGTKVGTTGTGPATHLFDDQAGLCTDINFAGGDTLTGWLHTNDSIKIGGAANFVRIKSTDAVESSWASDPASGHVNPGPNLWWDGTYAPGTCAGCMKPSWAKKVDLPPDNQKLNEYADPATGGTGCLYTGPTKITFLGGGGYKVWSPYSKKVNPGCGTSPLGATEQTVAGPPNGVIYVQPLPSSPSDPNYRSTPCTPGVVGYPVAGDITAYDCTRGDAFVSGTVKGRLTVGTANNIVVVDDLKYNSGPPPSGTDVLGLIANNYVQVYHPVNGSGANISAINSVEIDAAILAVRGSFIVQNYGVGAQLGTLSVRGAIGQKYRGTVGTGGSGGCSTGTGYCKDYQYDTRFPLQSPPFFLDPVSAQWKKTAVAEQRN